MMKTLRIADKRERVLSFGLLEILAECGAYQDRTWVAWDVDCVNSPWWNVFADGAQVQLSAEQLWDYAQNVLQTIDGYFLAIRREIDTVPELDHVGAFIPVSDVIIHAHDATYWEVTTADEQLIARLAGKFTQVQIYDEVMHGGADCWRV